MIYFIYGNQSPTIKHHVNKIAKSFLGDTPLDEFSFVKYDGHNYPVQDAVNECTYVSLGYDKKVVVLENCYFLLKPKPKNKIESEQDYKTLIDFISGNVKNTDSAFIMTVYSLQIDEKNEIFSLLKENKCDIKVEDPDEKSFIEYIRLYAKKQNIVIDNDAVNELASRTDGDVADLKSNMEKLALYTDHIKYNDVVKMVPRKLESSSFLLSNLLIEGKNVEAVALFKDLRVSNVEPITLIGQLANQFRLLNQIRYLLKTKKLSQEEVAKQFKMKPGRVYFISKSFGLISEAGVNNVLEDLYKLDYEIKSGRVDRFYSFEMFLLKFKRN